MGQNRTTTSPAKAGDGAAPKQKRGPVRKTFRLCGFSVVGLLILAFILHTIIIREIAEAVLASQVGCRVHIGSARVASGGAVMLRGVQLRAPGIQGNGGAFVESEAVRAEIDWMTLLAGGQGVRSLRLVDPIVRLSQDADTGALNLLRVGGAGSVGPGGARTVTPLPTVEFVAGRVEFGEHQGSSYTVLASIPVEGQVGVPSIAIPEYEIDLVEIVGSDDRPPMRLTGDFNVETLAGTLQLVDLDLERWQGWAAPGAASAMWKQMNIQGKVAEASFTAERDSSITAWFTLRGVDLTAPIQAPGLDARFITASDVDGLIRFTPEGVTAEIVGIVEDLPARMVFTTEGLGVNAPLTCTITTERFDVHEEPSFLRFIPAEARDLFHEFGGPTGEVAGFVTLSRGEPAGGEAAPIVARGELRIENGRGEHEVFPYPVESITGTIRFDENEIELIDVRGESPSGATLVASGTIAPPTEGTDVHIEMYLADIPTDAALDRAMPVEARRVLRTLIDAPALDDLRSRGLLRTSADTEALIRRRETLGRELEANIPGGEGSAVRRVEVQRELRAIERQLQAPLFDLGGVATARVGIEREGASDSIRTTIDIRLERAGLLPEPFPYPFVATDFNIVVNDDGATATAARLDGLTGASADLIAAITFPNEDNGDPGATLIDIDLKKGPVDALLLAATPAPTEEGADNLYDVVSDLRVGGDLTGSIRIDSGEADEFRADLQLTNLMLALPQPEDESGEDAGHEPLMATGLHGAMVVTDTRVVVGPIDGEFQGSPLTVRGLWRESDPASASGPTPIRAELKLEGFRLGSRIDPVIALLGEEPAARWAALRDSRAIEGMLDLTTSIELTAGKPAEVRTALRNIRDLSFLAFGSRVGVGSLSGVVFADTERVRLLGCQGPITIDDRLAGRASINGELSLDPEGDIAIEAALTSMEYDAELLASLLPMKDDLATIRSWLELRRPSGMCEAEVSLSREQGEELRWGLDLTPTAIGLLDGEGTLLLTGSGQGIRIDEQGGAIDGFNLRNDDMAIGCTGNWRFGERPAIDLDFTVDAQRLTPSMSALLPGDVTDLVDSLEIGIDGPWKLSRGELRWRTDAQQFVGEAEFEGLRSDPGVAITEAQGSAVLRIERSEELTEPQIECELQTGSMRLAGVRMTDGTMSLRSGDLPGRLRIDSLGASTHGGRVDGTVTIDTTTQGDSIAIRDSEGVWYEVMLDFAGVEVESLLNETALRASEGSTENGERTPIEGFTGTFDGRLSMAGEVGKETTRRGRGVFRIEGGELLMAPLMVPIIELSNLRAPSGEALERADAEVYLDGSVVRVESVRFRSDSISIVGAGALTWPGMRLNLAFNSQSNDRVPILSDLMEGLRNELITTVVTGTLLEPRFSTEAFTGTRQALDDMFGGGGTRRDGPEPSDQGPGDPEGVSSPSPSRTP